MRGTKKTRVEYMRGTAKTRSNTWEWQRRRGRIYERDQKKTRSNTWEGKKTRWNTWEVCRRRSRIHERDREDEVEYIEGQSRRGRPLLQKWKTISLPGGFWISYLACAHFHQWTMNKQQLKSILKSLQKKWIEIEIAANKKKRVAVDTCVETIVDSQNKALLVIWHALSKVPAD